MGSRRHTEWDHNVPAGYVLPEERVSDQDERILNTWTLLGSGNFSTVYQATLDHPRLKKVQVAVKVANAQAGHMLDEVMVMSTKGPHVNVVQVCIGI